ncbi:MAG: hypothetical protein IT410_04495 [Candidatus Doudnabacteria bacterium]|nr:hypothetical protein [Candidatus Doudnabacteria bacterium]
MNDFLTQVVELRHADPDRIIGQLMAMFTQIAKMDPVGVLVAYQTIKATAEVADMVNNVVIRSLLVATEAQMTYLAASSGNKAHLERFKVATGGVVH